jgi:hypothetical protein
MDSPRQSLLAILDRPDAEAQRTLRDELGPWYVVACGVDDVESAARSLRVSMVLVVGDIRLTSRTWAALDTLAIGPQRVAYAPTVDLARPAVDRIARTLRVPVAGRPHR